MSKNSKELRQILDERIVSVMKCRFLILFVAAGLAALVSPPPASAAPILGSDLASFAVLGATGVTNVPVSTIGGNLGSAVNPSIGGGYIFSSGSMQANTSLAQNAQVQLDAAILAVNAFVPDATITDGDLDAFQSSQTGGVIAPGTYAVAANSTNLVGDLFLDGGGSSFAQWYFQFSSALITGTSSNVFVQNVDTGANVGIYWTVASDATLNGPTFAGNVLANGKITSDGNLTIDCGRLLSANSQVTLIKDKISIAGCGNTSGGFDQGVDIGSGGTGGSNGQIVGQVVPEPGTFLLFGFGLAGLVAFRKKFQKA